MSARRSSPPPEITAPTMLRCRSCREPPSTAGTGSGQGSALCQLIEPILRAREQRAIGLTSKDPAGWFDRQSSAAQKCTVLPRGSTSTGQREVSTTYCAAAATATPPRAAGGRRPPPRGTTPEAALLDT